MLRFKANEGFELLPDDPRLRRGPGGPPPGTSTLGVKLFLAALSFLFAASIVAYVIVVRRIEPAEQPLLPRLGLGLGAATGLLLASSAALALGVRAIRRGDADRLARYALWTLCLGFAFLGAQSFNWWQLVALDLPPNAKDLHGFTFYMLTVTHALHVVGGLVPLALVTVRAQARRYTAESHEGVTNVALYWHFLDVVWLLMLATMFFTLVA